MKRLVRLIVAAGVLAGLIAFLRALLEEPRYLSGQDPRDLSGRDKSADGGGARKAQSKSPKRNGTAGLTRDELYEEAQRLQIEGRSKMNKRQLQRAIAQTVGSGS